MLNWLYDYLRVLGHKTQQFVLKAKRFIKKDHTAYLASMIDTKAPKTYPRRVPRVCEYLDMSPKVLSRLPPEREFEFTTEVEHRTTLISQTLYYRHQTN